MLRRRRCTRFVGPGTERLVHSQGDRGGALCGEPVHMNPVLDCRLLAASGDIIEYHLDRYFPSGGAYEWPRSPKPGPISNARPVPMARGACSYEDRRPTMRQIAHRLEVSEIMKVLRTAGAHADRSGSSQPFR